MLTKFCFFILSVFALVSCEGSRSARMINTVERAIEDHNNGDSTTLIVLIVFGVLLGVLWLIKNKDIFE